jgi:hypothetical protein
MPYHVEKGPYLSVIEDYANQTGAPSYHHAASALVALRSLTGANAAGAAAGLAAMAPLLSANIQTPPPDPSHPAWKVADVIRSDWLGMSQDATGNWVPQQSFGSAPNDHTGYWYAWYGDAAGILCQTFISALEVSLGLPPGGPVPSNQAALASWVPEHHWPIDLVWKCPQPWFEGWIVWREIGTGFGQGQVTVIVATPGNGAQVSNTPYLPGASTLNPSYAAGETQGVWVVTHLNNNPVPMSTIAPSPAGTGAHPTFGATVRSTGPIVVVSPHEKVGGVTNPPRRYVAP